MPVNEADKACKECGYRMGNHETGKNGELVCPKRSATKEKEKK